MVVMVAVLFFYVMVSQVWPQEKTGESQENKFIILTSPRNKKDCTKPKATWESANAGHETAAVAGGSLGHSP